MQLLINLRILLLSCSAQLTTILILIQVNEM